RVQALGPVVPQNEELTRPQDDVTVTLERQFGHHAIRQVFFIQLRRLAVGSDQVDAAILNLDMLARKSDYALDKELLGILGIAEYHDIASLRLVETVSQLVYHQILMVMEIRLH